MGGLPLHVLRQVDDSDGLEGTSLDAYTATNTQYLRYIHMR
jgi:hypothetical protein